MGGGFQLMRSLVRVRVFPVCRSAKTPTRTDWNWERVDGDVLRKGEVMSLTVSSQSVPGTLRQEVLVDGRHVLVTDEPEAVGGGGSAPAPHELLPAALASCISTTLVMYARTRDWPLDTVHVDVEYDHRSTPRTFEIDIEVTGDLSEAQRAMLEKVAAACPVRRAIESGIRFEERLELLNGAATSSA
jgi:putative redox protein